MHIEYEAMSCDSWKKFCMVHSFTFQRHGHQSEFLIVLILVNHSLDWRSSFDSVVIKMVTQLLQLSQKNSAWPWALSIQPKCPGWRFFGVEWIATSPNGLVPFHSIPFTKPQVPQAQCEHGRQKYKDLYGNPDKNLKKIIIWLKSQLKSLTSLPLWIDSVLIDR